jgi:GNAT superfamily N-acetyltransferase
VDGDFKIFSTRSRAGVEVASKQARRTEDRLFPEAAMATGQRWQGSISKAPDEDRKSIRAHLLRLDRETRYCRFGNFVTDEFLVQYAARAPDLETIIFGCWINGEIRGIGELRRFGVDQGEAAEAAFTVERPFTDLGIGTALMAAVIQEAARTGVRELFTCFSLLNRRMRRITQKFEGSVLLEGGDCIGRIPVEVAGVSSLREPNHPRLSVSAAS